MKKGACSGQRLHWLFGQWIRTSCPLTVLFCTHVTELETQIHVCICARSGALIASAIRLSLHLHPTRPLQGATLVRHTPLAGSSGLSRAVGAGFHVVPVLPGLTARNIPYPLHGGKDEHNFFGDHSPRARGGLDLSFRRGGHFYHNRPEEG